MSFILFAPSIPFTRNIAIESEKINNVRKEITENVRIIFLPTLNVRSLASIFPNVTYSLINILIAIGIPAVDMFRNRLYML